MWKESILIFTQKCFTHAKSYYSMWIAFRWIVPGNPNDQRIPDEATEFILPQGSTAWYHDPGMQYEGVYEKKNLDTVSEGEWAAAPVTTELPGKAGYISIMEANLVNYSGMALKSNGKHSFVLSLAQHQPVSYHYELRYSKEDVERSMQPAAITGVKIDSFDSEAKMLLICVDSF